MACLMTNRPFDDLIKTGPEKTDYICCSGGQTLNLSPWSYQQPQSDTCIISTSGGVSLKTERMPLQLKKNNNLTDEKERKTTLSPFYTLKVDFPIVQNTQKQFQEEKGGNSPGYFTVYLLDHDVF